MSSPVKIINIADDRFDAIVGTDVLSFFDFHFFKNGEFQINLT